MSVADVVRYLMRRNAAFFIVLASGAVVSSVTYEVGWLHSDIVVTTAIFFIVVLGLDLLYGCAGLLSFGHVGFFAIGAYSVAILHAQFALPPLASTAFGLFLSAMLGYGLGGICLRLSGSYFMLGTLAFGIMINATITVWYTVTGGDAGLGDIPRPGVAGTVFSTDLSFGLFAWLCAIIIFWLTLGVSRSKIGRAARAIRSDEVAASCLGVNVARLKMNFFVISACFAALGGSLFAMYNGAVHPYSFSLSTLLDLLLMMFFGGEGTIWGALLGTAFMRLLPDLSGPLHGGKILFSGILFTIIIFAFPRGIGGAIEDLEKRFRKSGTGPPAPAAEHLPFTTRRVPEFGTLLELTDVSRSFGGVSAVDGVSFQVANGQIKGLMGPNGAGKSTIMNLITGVLSPDGGEIALAGKSLRGLRPDLIARRGIQRTFQHERLFAQLTVVENIMVGQECGVDASMREIFASAIGLPETIASEKMARREAADWLGALGLAQYADVNPSALPYGLRKLVEVARCCAASPVILLLDEAVAGLNDVERRAFRKTIASLHQSGLVIIIIEHDIDFIMELCDEICVINFGHVIADDTPSKIKKNPEVIAAYLGQ